MRTLKRETLAADLEAGDITQDEYDEKIKEIAEQEEADKKKEKNKEAKKNKKNSEPVAEMPAVNEGEVLDTGVPAVDVIEKTAMTVGEIESVNEEHIETEAAEITENNNVELEDEKEGGKQ